MTDRFKRFTESLLQNQMLNLHNSVSDQIKKAMERVNVADEIRDFYDIQQENMIRVARGIDIAEDILNEQNQKLLIGYDNLLPAVKKYESTFINIGKSFKDLFQTEAFKNLHADANKASIFLNDLAKQNSAFIKLATGTSTQLNFIKNSISNRAKEFANKYTSALSEQHSQLTKVIEQIDRSSLINIFEKLELPQYTELLQPELLESLRDDEYYIDDQSIITDTKNEIIDNLSSDKDLKFWSKKSIKVLLAILFILELFNTVVSFYKNMEYLISSTKSIKTEKQVHMFIEKASKKIDFNDLVDYRLTIRNLNLRAKPNTKSEIIKTLPIATTLFIIDDSQPYWLKIEVEFEKETFEGWVSKRYTKKFQ